jgi:hypothetical protein
VIFFGSCSRAKNEPIVLNLNYALSTAAERRDGINKPGDNDLYFFTQNRSHQTINIYELSEPMVMPSTISSEEAVSDARMLFGILREYYAPYIYFGGDDVFLPMLDILVETLSDQDIWFTEQFNHVLFHPLSQVIRDNHMWLGRFIFEIDYRFYVISDADQIFFGKSEKGFFNVDTNQYVADLVLRSQSLDINDTFRLSLSDTGVFYYAPVLVTSAREPVPLNLTVVYEDKTETNVPLSRQRATQRRFQPPSLVRHQEIPIITVMAMGATHCISNPPDEANLFLSLADEVKDDPVVIVDARSNRGGNAILGSMWLHRFLGEIVPTNFFAISIPITLPAPPLPDRLVTDEEYEIIEAGLAINEMYFRTALFDDIHYIHLNQPDGIIANEQLIILLVDRYTASAGEYFADQLLNMQNTLIVGQNTMGTFLTGVTAPPLYLPNSGIQLGGLGGMVTIAPQGYLPEGMGLAPDIWIRGDALTAVLSMLKNDF